MKRLRILSIWAIILGLNVAVIMPVLAKDGSASVWQQVRPVQTDAGSIQRNIPAVQKASLMPVLQWPSVNKAVSYDVEILKKEGTDSYQLLMPVQSVIKQGYQFYLPASFTGDTFYWRVRPLDFEGKTVGSYSSLQEVRVDRARTVVKKPIPLTIYNQGHGTALLYPVYDWLPMPGAVRYEIEILNASPENPNGVVPSIHRIDSINVGSENKECEQYDWHSRKADKPFYWRVHGFDAAGQAMGKYSDAVPFSANPNANYTVAAFGDSITHGGGGFVNAPTNWTYSYLSYLDFPCMNLGRSGDTSADLVKRFDADVLPFHPQYLLVLMGTNSLRLGVPAQDIIADIKTVQKKCRRHGIKPVLLTLPPMDPGRMQRVLHAEAVADWQKTYAAVNAYIRTQVHIDIDNGMADDKGNLSYAMSLDGLHMDPPGKAKIGAAINAAWPRITSLPDTVWTH